MNITEFLPTIKDRLPGRVLYAKVWGSRSHDTHLPNSDWDYLGVYAASNRDLLSIDATAIAPATVTGDKPDYQIHEAKKICELLIKGNPGIIEMLFTEHMQIMSPEWEELRAVREQFLTQQVVAAHLGFVTDQMKRLTLGRSVHSSGGKPGEKWAYHALRLTNDAERISRNEPPIVYKTGADRDLYMGIREGRTDLDEVVQLVQERVTLIEARKPWANLPETAPVEWLNNWLLGSVRKLLSPC
jgi:hypothetical protein